MRKIAIALRRMPLYHGRGEPFSVDDKLALALAIRPRAATAGNARRYPLATARRHRLEQGWIVITASGEIDPLLRALSPLSAVAAPQTGNDPI